MFPQKSNSPFSQMKRFSNTPEKLIFDCLPLSNYQSVFLWRKLSSKGRKMHKKVCKVLRAMCRNIQLAILPDSDLVSRAISELPPIVLHDSPLGPPLKVFLFYFVFFWMYFLVIPAKFWGFLKNLLKSSE